VDALGAIFMTVCILSYIRVLMRQKGYLKEATKRLQVCVAIEYLRMMSFLLKPHFSYAHENVDIINACGGLRSDLCHHHVHHLDCSFRI
jgi:hypothetical protein